MTKIRKVKRRKKYRANVNRKRLRNKLRRLPSIPCKEIKQAWEVSKSVRTNLNQMGLVYDPNTVLEIPSAKKELLEDMKLKKIETEDVIESEDETMEDTEIVPPKIHVAKKLLAEARAPRERMFRLPKGQVEFITYFLDKYGEDYKAMARDKKNYNQLTWRQMRAKIKTFKSIPEQYNEYLRQKSDA